LMFPLRASMFVLSWMPAWMRVQAESTPVGAAR